MSFAPARFRRAPRRAASCLVPLLLLFAFDAHAQSPGIDAPPLVDPYFDGTFPLGTPGDGTEIAYRLVDAYPNLRFDDPLVYTPLKGTDRIFVASRGGLIHSFVNDPATATKELCLDLEAITAVVWDGGFLGLDFHPEFGQGTGKDWMFVYHSVVPDEGSYPGGFTNGFFGTYLRLARYEVDPTTYVADPESEVQLFNVRLYNGSHRGGGLTFGGDGFLYLSIGDQFRYETAQDLATNFEGGVIRIDVDMDPTRAHPPRRFMGTDAGEEDEFTGNAYWIPNDNPFLDTDGGVFEEFWTLGNRAPHRMTYDAMSDRFWSGEVGQSRREEINIIDGGNNYGWPFREGLRSGVRSEPDSIGGVLTDPVIDFPSRSDARAIIGGYIYRGTELPDLYGKFVCGDHISSKLFAISYDDSTGTATRADIGTFTPGFLGTFGQDLDGEIYLCGLGPQRPIYKLERIVTNEPAPATLSETGFFQDLATLEPSPQAIPYGINEPFWSDGARKSRWALVPHDGSFAERIGYSAVEPWGFPEGTVWVKHFELPVDETEPLVTIPVETRFLVEGYLGEVYGLTYQWRPDGSDADLVSGGADVDYTITTANGTRTQTWRYPSNAECLQCHNPTAGPALGFSTKQLNRDVTYPSTGRTDNQLVTLSEIGLLDATVGPEDVDDLPRLTSSGDATAPLHDRALSYLDANCSYCHQPGTSNRANIDARVTTPLAESNLVRVPGIEDLGIPEAFIVSPQRPARSLAHVRMGTRDGGQVQMPPIASNEIDLDGTALVRSWIEILDADFTRNAAVGRPVAQSSTYNSAGADRAVDGDTTGDYGEGSVSHTEKDQNAWWEIDLQSVVPVQSIRLWNRTDCCSNRLSDFYVLVSETPFASQDLATTLADSNVARSFHSGTAGRTTDFDFDVSGRYVRVQLDGEDFLQLAEVQIFANDYDGPPIETIVLGNPPTGGGEADSTTSNLVVNLTDTYENDTSGFVVVRLDEIRFEAAALGDPVTPFVASMANTGGLRVDRIGTTRIREEMELGENVFAFDAIAPPVVRLSPGERIVAGFMDSYPDGSGSGISSVVAWSADASSDSVLWIGGPIGDDAGSIVPGEVLPYGTSAGRERLRDYAFTVSMTRMLDPDTYVTSADTPGAADRAVLNLANAAPNPFNPSTVLRLRLTSSATVDWAVFDVRGRRVKTFARERLEAGDHVRVWTGEDDRGERVASGVYFQRAMAAGELRSNKLVLLK